MISILTTLTVLSGFLTIDNQPAVNQHILVIHETTEEIIYSGTTDSTGHFEWDYSEDLIGQKVSVLGKFDTDDVVTTEYQEIKLSGKQELNLNVNTQNLESVEFNVIGSPNSPPSFSLHLEAKSLDGIPENLMPFASMQDTNVMAFYFYRSFNLPVVHLNVKKGSYLIDAHYFVLSNPSDQSAPKSFKTSSVEQNGKMIQSNSKGTFEIQIESPSSIKVSLAPSEN